MARSDQIRIRGEVLCSENVLVRANETPGASAAPDLCLLMGPDTSPEHCLFLRLDGGQNTPPNGWLGEEGERGRGETIDNEHGLGRRVLADDFPSSRRPSSE